MKRSGWQSHHFPHVTGLGHFSIFRHGNFFGARIVTGGVCPLLKLGISGAYHFKTDVFGEAGR